MADIATLGIKVTTDGVAQASSDLDKLGRSGANAAVGAPMSLEPGEEATVTFALTWHFPNASRWGHEGNYYAELFPNA